MVAGKPSHSTICPSYLLTLPEMDIGLSEAMEPILRVSLCFTDIMIALLYYQYRSFYTQYLVFHRQFVALTPY